jgi:hypothetical protein
LHHPNFLSLPATRASSSFRDNREWARTGRFWIIRLNWMSRIRQRKTVVITSKTKLAKGRARLDKFERLRTLIRTVGPEEPWRGLVLAPFGGADDHAQRAVDSDAVESHA